MNDKKEYIKNFIIRSIKGKVDQTEIQQVRGRLMNYSREDWRDLKILGKELIKEAIDEQINKESEKVPSDWKEIIRDFSYSAVNLTFAILDEEVIYQSMLLEKQGGLDEKTKIIKVLPVISQSIDQIVARVPSAQVNKNWKADKSLTAKLKKITRRIQSFYFRSFIGSLSEENVKQKFSELIGILESLTPEEIAILKGKSKIFVNNLFNKFAPSQIKNSPEIRQFINSFMNLIDAIYDEKMLKDAINIWAKTAKFAIQNERTLNLEGQGYVTVFQAAGTETELKSLIRNLTQHLNKLAGEGEKKHLSTEKEESIIQRLTESGSTPQSPNQEDTNLGDIWKNNLIVNGLGSSGNLEDFTEGSLREEFDKVFLDTQIKPKWYQNPWVIWSLVAVVFVIGGLIIWWLIGRKKEKKVSGPSNNWE